MEIRKLIPLDMLSLQSKQGIKIGPFKIDPVLMVIVLIGLSLSISFTNMEKVIYWLKLGGNSNSVTLKTDPLKVVNQSLFEYVSQKAPYDGEHSYIASLEAVTTFPLLEEDFQARLRFVDSRVNECGFFMEGKLKNKHGGFKNKKMKAEIVCEHYGTKVKLGDISFNNLYRNPKSTGEKKFSLQQQILVAVEGELSVFLGAWGRSNEQEKWTLSSRLLTADLEGNIESRKSEKNPDNN